MINYTYKAKTVRLVDADTFDFDVDLGFGIMNRVRVRVNDYDAPETYSPRNDAELHHGRAASAFAKTLLEGNTVTLKTYKIEIYGRWGAEIFLDDGRNFVEIMKENGFQKLTLDEYKAQLLNG